MPEDLQQPDATKKMEPLEIDSTELADPKGIIALTVKVPISTTRPERDAVRSAARWRTPEFIFYCVAFILVVPFMFKIPMDLSQASHPSFLIYRHKLSQGWLFGRLVDNSDRQYRSFRDNIPALVLLSISQVGLNKLCSLFPMSQPPRSRITFLLPISIVILLGLHGASALKILAILYANYYAAKSLGGLRPAPFVIWTLNMGILLANEVFDGYRFAALHPGLEFLDRMQGFYPRWNVIFKMTMLRLISFSMDYHWACKSLSARVDIPKEEKQRTSTSHPIDVYTFTNYLCYAIYTPLYIAGPILTFNNFMWQIRRPLNTSIRTIASYLVRFLVCLLCMEFVLHYMYVVAMKDTSAWRGRTPAEIAMIGLWNLIIVWLKLLIPWRFFRLWALADGIDPPENMIRCVCNNYSMIGFWKSWHRSYNLWTVRYIYIPLGGSSNIVLSTLLVFTFVALWHDLTFRLLAWGWLVSLIFAPELAAKRLFSATKYGDKAWYRHVCACGAVLNILMMMMANLVGFVIGTEGMLYMNGQLFGTWQGLQFIMVACIGLFIGVQVMFEYREEELRQGISRRC